MRSAGFAILLSVMLGTGARGQEPVIVDTPTVKVLRGLTIQQFEAEPTRITPGQPAEKNSSAP